MATHLEIFGCDAFTELVSYIPEQNLKDFNLYEQVKHMQQFNLEPTFVQSAIGNDAMPVALPFPSIILFMSKFNLLNMPCETTYLDFARLTRESISNINQEELSNALKNVSIQLNDLGKGEFASKDCYIIIEAIGLKKGKIVFRKFITAKVGDDDNYVKALEALNLDEFDIDKYQNVNLVCSLVLCDPLVFNLKILERKSITKPMAYKVKRTTNNIVPYNKLFIYMHSKKQSKMMGSIKKSISGLMITFILFEIFLLLFRMISLLMFSLSSLLLVILVTVFFRLIDSQKEIYDEIHNKI